MQIIEDISQGNNILAFHARYEVIQKELTRKIEREQLKGQLFFLSSGTTSETPKGYSVTHEAMFANAQASNDHLGLKHGDGWGLCLPPYHVGGLSVFYRSILLKTTPLVLYPWDPQSLVDKLVTHNIAAISLVPTQLFDLIALKSKCPKSLKVALIGGDFLGRELEKMARDLGWPIVKTFGMSEVCSQLATANRYSENKLTILPIHHLKTDHTKRIWVKSSSLFSYEILYQNEWQFQAAKIKFDEEGYYPLPDMGEIHHNELIPLGRYDGSIKSSGQLIDFMELKHRLDDHMLGTGNWGKMELRLKHDERRGHALILLHQADVSQETIQSFISRVSPVKIHLIQKTEFNRNDLGKLKY